MRANVFRFAPESGHRAMQSARPFRAISGLSRCSLRAGQMPATEAAGQEATKGARRHPMIIASRRITPHEILPSS